MRETSIIGVASATATAPLRSKPSRNTDKRRSTACSCGLRYDQERSKTARMLR